jgi:hypothetical protein
MVRANAKVAELHTDLVSISVSNSVSNLFSKLVSDQAKELLLIIGAFALAVLMSLPVLAHAQDTAIDGTDAASVDADGRLEFYSHGQGKRHPGGGQQPGQQPDQGGQQDPEQTPQGQAPTQRGGAVPAGQQQVADAQAARQGLFFAEVKNVRVVRILPDDTQGLQHQKWVVALDNGSELMAVYNMDICDRVPLKVGDTMSIGGQYIWDKGGGLLHWLHDDPRGSRPNGYVEVGGSRYGAVTHPNR